VSTTRLQKYLAEAGVASRRAGEVLMQAGRVEVNGKIIRELGVRIDPSADEVRVDGERIKPRKKHYVALHKPRNYLCSRGDSHGRRTVSELLPREWSILYPVGRLDYDTEGLLFLTNDGDFSLRLTHPRYGVAKRYLARVEGHVTAAQSVCWTRGITDRGEHLRAERVWILSASAERSEIELELTEGKNREVRRLLESQGLRVLRLLRTQIGPIRLGELPAGRWRVLQAAEIKSLRSPTTDASDRSIPQH
jgi:23S rRNA pseudouridine2605 synthase